MPVHRSVYRWQGKVETEDEALAIIKTTSARVGALQRAVGALHPYDEPEFVVVPIETGSRGYLQWIVDSVQADAEA